MKRLMTVVLAAVLAGGAYAQDPRVEGPSCPTWDFKASLTLPVAKAAGPADCFSCPYRTKGKDSLSGWLVVCDCDSPALVLVIGKGKTAYVTTSAEFEVLNYMGKKGTEAEALLLFTICDINFCADDNEVPSWEVAAAGFGKVKVSTTRSNPCVDPEVDALLTDLSGTLVGRKPAPAIVTPQACDDDLVECSCALPCPFDGSPVADVPDAVAGTWSAKYNKKFSESQAGTVAQIADALKKQKVTKVIENCTDMGTVDQWQNSTALLRSAD